MTCDPSVPCVVVGQLAIDPETWAQRRDELVTTYGCSEAEADEQLRCGWEFEIGQPGVGYAVPVAYVVGVGTREEIGAYMGFGAHIVAGRRLPNSRLAVVLEIPAEHADWQSKRLQSGLRGGQRFATQAEAEALLPEFR